MVAYQAWWKRCSKTSAIVRTSKQSQSSQVKREESWRTSRAGKKRRLHFDRMLYECCASKLLDRMNRVDVRSTSRSDLTDVQRPQWNTEAVHGLASNLDLNPTSRCPGRRSSEKESKRFDRARCDGLRRYLIVSILDLFGAARSASQISLPNPSRDGAFNCHFLDPSSLLVFSSSRARTPTQMLAIRVWVALLRMLRRPLHRQARRMSSPMLFPPSYVPL